MKIYNSIEEYVYVDKAILVMGMFDGLHKGHIALIDKAKELKEQQNGKIIVYTFANHPMEMFDSNFKLLLTKDEKIKYFEKLGIDGLVISEFDKDTMNIEADDFVSIVKTKINPDNIVVGFDYTFGKGKQGTTHILKETFDNVFVINEITKDNKKISSTLLRECVSENKFEEFIILTGRPYSINGEVRHGENIGSKNQTPTTNVAVDSKKYMPKPGVYATKTIVDDEEYISISNLGSAPTFNREEMVLETHIFGFNKQIYGKNIEVCFYKKIRDVKKFDSIDELYTQIKKDIINTKNYFLDLQ